MSDGRNPTVGFLPSRLPFLSNQQPLAPHALVADGFAQNSLAMSPLPVCGEGLGVGLSRSPPLPQPLSTCGEGRTRKDYLCKSYPVITLL